MPEVGNTVKQATHNSTQQTTPSLAAQGMNFEVLISFVKLRNLGDDRPKRITMKTPPENTPLAFISHLGQSKWLDVTPWNSGKK